MTATAKKIWTPEADELPFHQPTSYKQKDGKVQHVKVVMSKMSTKFKNLH